MPVPRRPFFGGSRSLELPCEILCIERFAGSGQGREYRGGLLDRA
jgi:hypothetical protein